MAKAGLKGVTVIVTRPEAQAEALCRAIEAAGGKVVRFPALLIVSLDSRKRGLQRRRLASVQRGDWTVFVSTNAVHYGLELMPGGTLPTGVRAAAVGAATAAALERRGVKPVVRPQSGYDSEALLDVPALKRIKNRRVLILKAPGGRHVLARELRRRGAAVSHIAVYRRERPQVDLYALAETLPKQGKLVTTVTSAELLHNLLHMMDAATYRRLQQAPLVVISARLKGLAEWSGFENINMAKGPGPAAIVAAVAGAVRSR